MLYPIYVDFVDSKPGYHVPPADDWQPQWQGSGFVVQSDPSETQTAEQQVQHTASSCSGMSVCDLIF